MRVIVGARAVQLGAVVLLAVSAILTWRQQDYLEQVGWSAVSRTRTEWPSLLATGPWGWLLPLAFVACAMGTLLLAAALIANPTSIAPDAAMVRRVGMALVITGLGMGGVAFPADAPGAPAVSWHATVHNLLYPAVPLGILTAAGLIAVGGRTVPCRSASRVLLPLMLVAFALTNVDSIAQLARYPAFGLLMAWAWTFSAAASRAYSNSKT